jgi:hypothetical protein
VIVLHVLVQNWIVPDNRPKLKYHLTAFEVIATTHQSVDKNRQVKKNKLKSTFQYLRGNKEP